MKKRRKSEIFWINHSRRSRTYRKKRKKQIKEECARNKRLILLYPWLAPRDWRTGKPMIDKRYRYISLWGDVPSGWTNVFGKMMCDEIQEALEKDGLENRVYVEQAKEKYGGLRLYMGGNDESYHIISIYEAISTHVCAECGRPHSPMMNFSWIIPYCEDCYNKKQKKSKYFYQDEYRNHTPEESEWRIPNVLKWERFSKDENTIIEEDITDRIKQIEQNWEKNHAKYLKKIEKKSKKIRHE